ncbi:adhesion G protein-coupled receptor G3-like [Oncorhynchus masou masou]|uniref:adhesion G protein-coupled receptor G3-like n=1 Tax=Oncorhynchus masou masou TaxID=90313 RepID=UPI003183B5CC
MKIRDLILIFICIPATLSTNDHLPDCKDALEDCLHQEVPWTRCYEDRITRCIQKGRLHIPNFYRWSVNASNQAEAGTDSGHRVHFPAHALQRSKRSDSHTTDYVHITMAVLNSSLFKLGLVRGYRSGEVLRQSVLAVRVGDHGVSDLDQPVRIAFRNTNVTERGTCVFWKDSENNNGEGDWSSEGCNTTLIHGEFVCSCNHLSFFAVLVNSKLSVDPVNAANLGYISYIGSSFSVVFTTVSLVMYTCLRKRSSEQSIGIHVHLTGALLFLHLSYLLSEWWVWHEADGAEGRVCLAFGLMLHWALLSTFTWLAIEGFHLYMLLVRVFNVYVRKYLLKLSLFGWGIPTVTVVACGFSGVYGRHSFYMKGANNGSSTDICWISSATDSPGVVVSYVTVSGYLGLVFLFNTAMLGVVVVKLWGQRGKGRMWKDWATLLGLSCVLGVPWGLAFCTYGPLSLPGLYLFSIFNCFQGVFLFLWFLALFHKGRPERSSVKDSSSQKMMETNLN